MALTGCEETAFIMIAGIIVCCIFACLICMGSNNENFSTWFDSDQYPLYPYYYYNNDYNNNDYDNNNYENRSYYNNNYNNYYYKPYRGNDNWGNQRHRR